MNRRNFGMWGVELGAIDFARALAAAGALRWWPFSGGTLAESLGTVLALSIAGADRRVMSPIDWYMPPLGEGGILPSEVAQALPAAELAQAWRTLVEEAQAPFPLWTYDEPRLRPRLRIVRPEYGFDLIRDAWILEQLAWADLVRGSIFLPVIDFSFNVSWHWPLRVGLPDDLDSREWSAKLGDRSWIPLLTSPAIIGEDASQRNELVLLPGDLRESVAFAASLSEPIRASCAVVLGGASGTASQGNPLLDTLRAETGALGVAVVELPHARRREWMDTLVEHLAHDESLDMALFAAGRKVDAGVPRMAFDQRLLERARLSVETRQLVRRLQAIPLAQPLSLSEQAASHLGMGDWAQAAEGVVTSFALEEHASEFSFDSEREEASTIAEVSRAAAASPRLAAAVPSELRHLQAELFENDGIVSRSVTAGPLRPDTAYAVDVSLGFGWRAGLIVNRQTVFPTIPGGEDRVLTCVFSEPNLLDQPQLGPIILPPIGESGPCRFHFQTGASGTSLDARILVIYENRILETTRLRASVADADLAPQVPDVITLEPEAYVATDLAYLEDWVRYGAVLHFNHNDEGDGSLTLVSDDYAAILRMPSMPEPVKRIVKRLSDVAWSPSVYGDLRSQETEELLKYLAFQGHALHEQVTATQNAREHLRRAGRIQVVTAREDALYPLELAYDDPAPLPTARLCPHAAEALGESLDGQSRQRASPSQSGGCRPGCPVGRARQGVVCPLGFWGLQRVIERQADAIMPLNAGDVGVRVTAAMDGDRLQALESALLGAHQKVDAEVSGCTDMVRQALAKATPTPVAEVSTWAEWEKRILNDHPTMLVLLPHCELQELVDRPMLEIGKEDELVIDNIYPDHVTMSKSVSPIVLLIGCRTGIGDGELQTFPVKFLRQGAALVLGTVANVLGRHAGPVTSRLVTELDRLARENGGRGTRFGDALLAAKRRLVAAGYPMALALAAYGDARWVIVKQ